jgi:hypothetical protein
VIWLAEMGHQEIQALRAHPAHQVRLGRQELLAHQVQLAVRAHQVMMGHRALRVPLALKGKLVRQVLPAQ